MNNLRDRVAKAIHELNNGGCGIAICDGTCSMCRKLADAAIAAMPEPLPKPENMKWLLDAANQVISELGKQEHLDSDTFRWLCNAVGQVERDLKRASTPVTSAASEPLMELLEEYRSEHREMGQCDAEPCEKCKKVAALAAPPSQRDLRKER